MSKEILTIQEEENGTYTYEIPELGIIDTAPTAKAALKDATDRIKIVKENPLERRAELEVRLDELQLERDKVIAELNGLELAITSRASKSEPIEAIELLEQIPMAESLIDWFIIDHSLEKVLGDVKCIAFAIGRDIDGDGDPECVPVIYSSRQIKTK